MAKVAEYGNTWVEYELIPLGGLWAIAVGIIKDNESGEIKLRIAKGKVKGKTRRVGEKIEHKLDNPADPITQVNRFNIKSKEEWQRIKDAVEKFILRLEKR